MHISSIHIRNFRKLKAVHVDIDGQQTIFVGANNSGKTSFMTALQNFLSKEYNLSTRDFTLNIWKEINKIGDLWMKLEISEEDVSINKWELLLPTLDIWFSVKAEEVYRVQDLLPALDWYGEDVGVRVRLEPKLDELIEDYKKAKANAIMLEQTDTAKKRKAKDLYPKSLWDFLEHGSHMAKYFTVKTYKLDPAKYNPNDFQITPNESIEGSILRNLIKIDSISAQRGFSDSEDNKGVNFGSLSKQLGNYYDERTDPYESLTEELLPILEEIRTLTDNYNAQLTQLLKDPLKEVENMNYPGIQNPSIRMNARMDMKSSISHESAVLFNIKEDDESLQLAENYNGLGYRNLISMYFQLMHFRDSWINDNESDVVKPIHLVLIEEPEAHLHAQAQQVFIKNAYATLTKDMQGKGLQTQMIVSTHSGHIAHEQDFKNLRYFQRILDSDKMPIAKVINLSGTFGPDKKTEKFVTRYIRLTHCDMFFADGIILVEGAGERILMPHFVSKEGLDNLYISIIEINGAHAHRFRQLIERIGIPTLIITDLDAQGHVPDPKHEGKLINKPQRPEIGKEYTTNNDTLKKWIPGNGNISIDDLMSLEDKDKVSGNIRVAYQHEVKIQYNGAEVSVIPYTLEDAVGLSNIGFFKKEDKGVGMVKVFHNAVQKDNIKECQDIMLEALESKNKAPFAVDLLYSENFEDLRTPVYIQEGLSWLKSLLTPSKPKEI